MLDLLRMELFRMRKMWAFFIVPLIFIVFLLIENITTSNIYSMSSDAFSLAESKGIDSNDLEQIELLDQRFELRIDAFTEYAELVPDTMHALFLAIFTVLFAGAESSSGFIKSIGGQVSKRSKLMFSKLAALGIFEIGFFVLTFAVNVVFELIFFKQVRFDDPGRFAGFMGIQLLLHFCVICFCMMVTIVTKSNMGGMILSLLTVLGFFNIIAVLLQRFWISTFEKSIDLLQFLMMENVSKLTYHSNGYAGHALAVCGVTGLISVALCCLSFEKRDMV